MYLVLDGNNFGFDTKKGIYITDEDYNKFFELQSQGKQFRLKEIPVGDSLFDYVEEYIPEIENVEQPTTLEEKFTNMFKAVLAGDMQTLAYELYPEDFKNTIRV